MFSLFSKIINSTLFSSYFSLFKIIIVRLLWFHYILVRIALQYGNFHRNPDPKTVHPAERSAGLFLLLLLTAYTAKKDRLPDRSLL